MKGGEGVSGWQGALYSPEPHTVLPGIQCPQRGSSGFYLTSEMSSWKWEWLNHVSLLLPSVSMF